MKKGNVRAKIAIKRLDAAWDGVNEELFELWKETNTQLPKFEADEEAMWDLKEFLVSKLPLLHNDDLVSALINKGNYIENQRDVIQ